MLKKSLVINIFLWLIIILIPLKKEINISNETEIVKEIINTTISSRSLEEPRKEEAIIDEIVIPTEVSEELIEWVKYKEGFVPVAEYNPSDNDGTLTLGYGWHSTEIKKGQTITEEKADEILRKDLKARADYVLKYMKYLDESLTQGQLDALTDFCYNMGNGKLSQLTNGKKRSLEEIAEHITAYCHDGNGKKLNGLIDRREKELQMFIGE